MFNRLKYVNRLFITAFVPIQSYDNVNPNTKTAMAMASAEIEKTETGMDRIYMMFSVDEFGEPSPEIVNIAQTLMFSIVAGGAIGGFVHSRNSYMDFMENNDATKFAHHYDAKKKLQDKVTTGFARGAWKWGWRLTAFTGCYSVIASSISVYRGKSGIIEHTMAGLTTGALYKMSLGVRGIVVGGTLGAILGSCCGVLTWGILKVSGTTMEEVRQQSVWMRKAKREPFNEAVREHIKSKLPSTPGLEEYVEKTKNLPVNLDHLEMKENQGDTAKK